MVPGNRRERPEHGCCPHTQGMVLQRADQRFPTKEDIEKRRMGQIVDRMRLFV